MFTNRIFAALVIAALLVFIVLTIYNAANTVSISSAAEAYSEQRLGEWEAGAQGTASQVALPAPMTLDLDNAYYRQRVGEWYAGSDIVVAPAFTMTR